MEKKMVKKLLALLMIITIVATDFFVLGSSLITYAANQLESETSNANVEFSAYFKKENGEKSDTIEKSIKSGNLNLYAKIYVKNEGRFNNGVIQLQSEHFKLISANKGTVKENTITLNQIDVDQQVEIALEIEPILADKMQADMLLETAVSLTGTYISSANEDGETITASRNVGVNYIVDESAEAESVTNIITNKTFAVNGVNKRIVQVLVKSRLSENQYPVKQTSLSVEVPKLSETEPESVNVLAVNDRTKISSSNWTAGSETVDIVLSNKENDNGEINWNKNGYDEVVITFIYPDTVDASELQIKTNLQMTVYNSNNTYTAMSEKGTQNVESNNIIMAIPEITTEEIYKGNLYAGIEKQYNTKTTLVVTNTGIVDGITLNESEDTYVLNNNKVLEANSKYISTSINKAKMLEILGTEGSITIKHGDITTVINNGTLDTNGDIIINYTTSIEELEITTTAPVATGLLEIKHTKSITENTYSKAQLQTVTYIKTEASVKETESETIPTEARVELKETISKAELTVVSEGNLSTTEPNDITLGITLSADGEQYDLYKNPEITIQLPNVVENVQIVKSEIDIMNDTNGEFVINKKQYDSNTKKLTIGLTGVQTAYPESMATQLYIPLELNVTLSKLATTQTSKITMTYTNANATQYYGETTGNGIVEKEIGIEAPAGLLKYFDLTSNSNTSISEEIEQIISVEDAGKELGLNITLVNNTESDMNNVKILGKLPTTGAEGNTLETTLKGIIAPNANVSYPQNDEYLLEIDAIPQGSYYTATVKVQISNNIVNGLKSYAQYKVSYNETSNAEASRKIWLRVAEDLEVKLTAQVGQETLNKGDIVKEGEVIKYTASVTNNTDETLENVQFTANVPEGTVVVVPGKGHTEEEGGYVYTKDYYYEEMTSIKIISEAIVLQPGQTYTKQYEIRVNTDITTGTEISHQVVATCGELTGNKEITNILEESNIRVTINRADDIESQLLAGGAAEYDIFIENLSNEEIANIEMKIISDTYDIITLAKDNEIYNTRTISIESIPEDGIASFHLYGNIKNEALIHVISTIVTDSNGETYRSNAVTEQLPYSNATITLSSSKNGKEIKEGDIVEYKITVNNTGNHGSIIKVKDQIPEYLEIQQIKINNTLRYQSADETDTETYIKEISNYFYQSMNVQPGKQGTMYIKTRVKYIPVEDHKKTITNTAIVSVDGVEKDTAEVTHILKANVVEEEKLENVISGSAWIDVNKNGQQDTGESALEGIKAKIYNVSTNYYVEDENGNILEVTTDGQGKYRFTNIENGSYMIVFEYDTDKYILTTYKAQNVDSAVSSKVIIQKITITGTEYTVAGTESLDVQNNVFDINIGLIEKDIDTPGDDNEPGDGNDGENEGDEEKPGDNEGTGDNDGTGDNEEIVDTKSISGYAWLDENRDGQKDNDESILSGIKVRLYDVSTKDYLKDKNGKIIETKTDSNGKYIFTNIEKGSYIVLFEYDIEEYEPTTYLAENVDTSKNSKVVLKKITINGEEKTLAVTDTIDVQDNIYNINIGLKEKLIFDLELNKYISRIVIQTSEKTKAYDYEDSIFEKVEIHRKQINGALVVLEYTIKVKNNGEMTGYAKNIVDYLPSGLTFSSELNTDWYLSGNYLYTKSLENIELKPGEEKEIKLILTKTMTNDNLGLINNRAEIYQDYNQYGNVDIDSTPNNQVENEDDIGSVDVIIMVSTGGSITAYIILLMINIILIGVAIRLMIKNNIIKVPTWKGGR